MPCMSTTLSKGDTDAIVMDEFREIIEKRSQQQSDQGGWLTMVLSAIQPSQYQA